ncbi:MAG: AraC family transcriptional regulator [Lachnospiraceae bacterium]|nr:AraC family transcriptional regulator [Lachnospiraceae bacterium]
MAKPMFTGDIVSSQRILYTPSDFARGSLIHLQEIGSLHAQKPHVSRRDNLSSFLFFTVVQGSGWLSYEGEVHDLHAGDCVFIDCKKPYSHETKDDLWTLRWVHFNGPTVQNIYMKYVERGGSCVIRHADTARIFSLWEELYAIAGSDDYIRDMRINESLTSLLTILMELSWHAESARGTTRRQNLLDIRRYLDEHYTDKVTLDELSDMFFINKFYLTRVFREQFGMSISHYITQLRITHAKQLLRFSNMTTDEIGSECGLSPGYYFSRTFKKVEGISPSEYRKQWVK